MSIGEADAEHDKQFLEECFVDNGDYEILANTASTQSIIVGRTGVGKSALLEELGKNFERVIKIEPEHLALKYISNSNILKFFESAGVNLDIFYTLLWQHTFAVELIKDKYQIDSADAKSKFYNIFSNLLSKNSKKKEALEYIEEWGEKFWVDTEKRIIDITEKLESNLTSTLSTNIPAIKFSAGGAVKLTEEERSSVLYHGTKVVNKVQIEKLARLINFLAEDVFTDDQKKTYVIIDKLDENWVDDDLRYKLIRALIETIKKFKKIENVKIIITLRVDLLNRVLEKTRDSGFQKEKYDSLFLRLEWTRSQLKTLLDKRINRLLKYQYTNSQVNFDDIFSNKIDRLSAADYILDRTLLRPRDAILFVNNCLIEAEGKTEITGSIIKTAEKNYSATRLESLQYEWFVEHPLLEKYISILHRKSPSFKVSTISTDELEKIIIEMGDCSVENGDIVTKIAHKYSTSSYPEHVKYLTEFKQHLLFTLYKIGVVGIKTDGTSQTRWIHDRTQDLIPSKVEVTSIVYIHKILWRTLAIDESQSA